MENHSFSTLLPGRGKGGSPPAGKAQCGLQPQYVWKPPLPSRLKLGGGEETNSFLLSLDGTSRSPPFSEVEEGGKTSPAGPRGLLFPSLCDEDQRRDRDEDKGVMPSPLPGRSKGKTFSSGRNRGNGLLPLIHSATLVS